MTYYNEVRPHRSLRRRTPLQAFNAREKAGPSSSFVKVDGRRLRFDRISQAGTVTLRYKSKWHHIGIGKAYAGWRVTMLVNDREIEIVGLDGSPLRRLTLDPTQNYQRLP
jgi:hypothetical protein